MAGVAAATMPPGGPVAALYENAVGCCSRPRNRPGLPTRRGSSC